MSAEQNKAMLRRVFEEGMNAQRLDVFDEIIAPDFAAQSPGSSRGPDVFKQIVTMYVTAFPDLNITIEEMIADGDMVASRGIIRGTHQDEFMGVPATGNSVSMEFIDMWRVSEDKFIENWAQLDMLSMMQQLGAVPRSEEGVV